jgi:hypothetical protein
VVRIKIQLASSILAPLGDNDNKNNPNYRAEGPDTRTKIIDWSKVRTTKVTVLVNDLKGNPVPSYHIGMSGMGVDLSGGHDHTPDRPRGQFVTADDDTVSVFSGATNQEGKVTSTYPTSGIGGKDSIIARGFDADKDTASAIVWLKVKGLEELGAGDHYKLIGVIPGHRINHYGSSTLVNKLKALADSVYSVKKYRIRISDISLPSGGPFDDRNNWDTPHQKHREGVSVDVSSIAETDDGSEKNVDEETLDKLFKKLTPDFKYSIENEVKDARHFHLTVR